MVRSPMLCQHVLIAAPKMSGFIGSYRSKLHTIKSASQRG
jgi:hypothetical protein